MRILIVEDDPGLARFLDTALRAEGHVVELAGSGPEALTRVARGEYGAVLLDLVLNGNPGIELLRRLRQEGVVAPILAIGDQAGSAHAVRALDAGADEYITRPVSQDEVAARVRALTRRAAPVSPVVLASQNVALNIVTHQAFVDGAPLRVTPKEFWLLHQLMRRQGEAVSRTELLEQVWAMHFDPGSNLVDVHVSRLRGKLHHAGAGLLIEAVRGTGFMLTPKEVKPGQSDVVA